MDVIAELQAVVMADPCTEEDGLEFYDGRLGNLFGLGCVRPTRQMLGLGASVRQWNHLIERDLGEFLSRILKLRPSLPNLLAMLAAQTRQIGTSVECVAISRAIIYGSMLQKTGANSHVVYQMQAFELWMSASFSSLPVSQLPRLQIYAADLVRAYCSNPARQRRHLARLLPVLDEIVGKEVAQVLAAETRAFGAVQQLHLRLALDWVLLGWTLKLYAPGEELQADQVIYALLAKFGKPIMQEDKSGRGPASVAVPCADATRWRHRWAPVGHLVGRAEEVPARVGSWRRALQEHGITGHSVHFECGE